jgi:hypothetical protein
MVESWPSDRGHFPHLAQKACEIWGTQFRGEERVLEVQFCPLACLDPHQREL